METAQSHVDCLLSQPFFPRRFDAEAAVLKVRPYDASEPAENVECDVYLWGEM